MSSIYEEKLIVDLFLFNRSIKGFARPKDKDDVIKKLAPAFYLNIGTECNQKCIYCLLNKKEHYYPESLEVKDIIRRAAKNGLKKAVFIGGEPTIRPDFVPLIKYMADFNFECISVTTNGLAFSDPEKAKRAIDAGLTVAHLSIDDFDPEVVKKISGKKRTLEHQLRTLENLLASGQVMVYLYAVVSKLNINHLKLYIKEAKKIMDKYGRKIPITFSGLKMTGEAFKNKKAIFVSISRTADKVKEAIDYGKTLQVDILSHHIPLCLMRGYESTVLELYYGESKMDLKTGSLMPSWRQGVYLKNKNCAQCVWGKICQGVHGEYIKLRGWKEFKPVIKITDNLSS